MEQWFNKRLTGDQFDQIYNSTKFIPSHALSDIVSKIIDNAPPNPGRFPTVANLKEGWEIWKYENPSRIKPFERVECNDCEGHGFVWYIKFDEEFQRHNEYVFRCKACENWEKDCKPGSPIPKMFVSEAINRGYKITHPIKYREDGLPDYYYIHPKNVDLRNFNIDKED